MNTYYRYIEFICDLMAIDTPEVQFKKGTRFYNQYEMPVAPFKIRGSAMSTSFVQNRLIKIDLNKIQDEDMVYFVIAHELRHIFQCDVVNDHDGEFESEVAPQIIDEWKTCLNTYQTSDVKDYENQSIEIDANAFAYVICMEIFEKPMAIKCDQSKLVKRVYEITQDYTKDEILDIAMECGVYKKNILA